MGKSKHASFSSIDKSNFQLFKAKFRENGFKKHLGRGVENKKHGENGEKEEKEKKHFWWKWLSFVRGRWSSRGGTRSDDKKAAMTMVAQYRGTSLYTERSAGDEMSASANVSYQMDGIQENEKSDGEKYGKTDGKRLTWNAEVFDNKSSFAENSETLLTSALFIRQDMNEIVESAVFIEPNLPKDYADSKKSDELSQNSLRVNKRRVSYKILENERNDQMLKTFKTVSEPTWDKRKKLLQQQRLQENINNLLEQFMFLEAEDVIDFSVSQSRLKESKKRIEFNGSSGVSSRQPLIRELSREVSPEILVNIKPFKEYVSDNYLSIKGSSTELVLKNCTCAGISKFQKKQVDPAKKESVEMLEKSKNVPEGEKVNERPAVPVLKCDVTFSEAKDSGCVEEDFCEVAERVLSLSAVEKEINNTCYENCLEEVSDLVSVQLKDDFGSGTPSCTVWGVYRSYSTCKSIVEEDEEGKEGEVGKEEAKKALKCDEPKAKKSLDEVLNNLDDSDHDIIFQKNISQFRKKINSKPRFDIKKSSFYSGKMDSKNVRLTKNVVEPVKPDKSSTGKIKETSLETSIKKEIEAHRFDCSELWKQGRKPKKVLENVFLQLSETKLISRTLATRIEAKSISFLQTFREVHDMLESNNFAIMEVEMPISWEKSLRNKESLKAESSDMFQWSDKPLLDVKKYETIAAMLSFQGRDFDGKFCTIENDLGNLGRHILQSSKFFVHTPKCFYLVQNQLLLNGEQKSDPNVNIVQLCHKSSSKYLTNGKMENEKLEKDEENLIKIIRWEKNMLKLVDSFYETDRNLFVQILNKPSYEYVARIYDCALASADTSSGSQPEPDLLKDNLNSSEETSSGSAHTELVNPTPAEKIIPNSETDNTLETRTVDLATSDKRSNPDLRFDGFQILYSKESLDDEEETTKMIFPRSYSENNASAVFPTKSKILGDEKELEADGERREEKKKKDRWPNEEREILKSLERKISRMLKYKSNSSPRENIHQTEFCFQEHRMRRSLVLPKETEKDFQHYKKRRLSLDKGIEIRKAGSALLESHAATLGNDRLYVQKKSNFGIEETVRSLILPHELKTVLESEHKSLARKKMFVFEKSGTNVVKKEIVAAFNFIKELNSCKGETKDGNKRMSLVIMLSRK